MLFTEKDLIKKMGTVGGFNIGNNAKNLHENNCYCKDNDELSKRDTCYDLARRTTLSQTYFGFKDKEADFLVSHTNLPAKSMTLTTFNTINQGLKKLRNLGLRNWNPIDMNMDKVLSYATPRYSQCTNSPTGGKSIPLNKNFIRVFSLKDYKYVYKPIEFINQSQKLTYNILKAGDNMESTKDNKPFESVISSMENAKHYTASAENSQASWEFKGKPQISSNYESTKFNLINHTNGPNGSISQMIKNNDKVFHRVKSVSEYADICRVSAERVNQDYFNSIKDNPKCFLKTTQAMNTRCDIKKTYGPFYK